MFWIVPLAETSVRFEPGSLFLVVAHHLQGLFLCQHAEDVEELVRDLLPVVRQRSLVDHRLVVLCQLQDVGQHVHQATEVAHELEVPVAPLGVLTRKQHGSPDRLLVDEVRGGQACSRNDPLAAPPPVPG